MRKLQPRHLTNPFRVPSQYVLIGGLLVAAFLFTLRGAAGMELFIFEGHRVVQGDWWRLFTAHLMHSNLVHWSLNAAGFVLVAILFARRVSAGHWLGFFFGGAVFVTSAYLVLHGPDSYYFGLSALFYGALVLGSLCSIRREPWLAWLTLGFVVARLLYGILTNGSAPTAVLIGAPVAEESHLYGAVWGLIYGLFYSARGRASR